MVIVNLLRSWLQRRKQRRARPPASRWHQGALFSRRLGLQLLEDRNQPNDLLGAGGTDYLDPTAGSSSDPAASYDPTAYIYTDPTASYEPDPYSDPALYTDATISSPANDTTTTTSDPTADTTMTSSTLPTVIYTSGSTTSTSTDTTSASTTDPTTAATDTTASDLAATDGTDYSWTNTVSDTASTDIPSTATQDPGTDPAQTATSGTVSGYNEDGTAIGNGTSFTSDPVGTLNSSGATTNNGGSTAVYADGGTTSSSGTDSSSPISVQVRAPKRSESNTPTVTVSVNDSSQAMNETVSIDVDLNHDGQFSSTETGLVVGYTSDIGTLQLTLPYLSNGSYLIRATVTNTFGDTSTGYAYTTVGPLSGQQMVFQKNEGQTDSRVSYYSQGEDYASYLTSSGAYLDVTDGDGTNSTFAMEYLGSNPFAQASGESKLDSTSNYYVGDDSSQWLTGIENDAKVRYSDVWSGVDVVYTGNDGQLEFTFEVKPGANVSQINLDFSRYGTVSVTNDGQLALTSYTTGQTVYISAPHFYQVDANGNQTQVSGGWVQTSQSSVALMVGNYDVSRTLYIDPSIVFSTLVGGNRDDSASGIGVDSSGNVYIAGSTHSNNFPVSNSVQGSSQGGNTDAVIYKLNNTGSNLLWSTYFGGRNSDQANDLALDSSGNVYVTGATDSNNFTRTNGSAGFNSFGNNNAWAAKFNTNGGLIYSTFLTGDNNTNASGNGIAVDSSGNAYIVGVTGKNLNTTNGAYQSKNDSRVTNSSGGRNLGFLMELSADASKFVYATYITGTSTGGGGNRGTTPNALALDTANNVYVVGTTDTSDIFKTGGGGGSIQSSAQGNRDAFVMQIASGGGKLNWGTFIGGSQDDRGNDIALDSNGNIYIVGTSNSNNLPVTSNAVQGSRTGTNGFGQNTDDAFVCEINQTGTAINYCTYLGTDRDESGNSITVDSSGNIYVAGSTDSYKYYNVNPVQSSLTASFTMFGNNDGFITVLNTSKSGSAQIIFSTNFGGTADDSITGIALDSTGAIYVCGNTNSNTSQNTNGGFFPTGVTGYNLNNSGGQDTFVAKLSAVGTGPAGPPSGTAGGSAGPGDFAESNETSDAADDNGTLTKGAAATSVSNLNTNYHTDTNLPDYDWYKWSAGSSGTFSVTVDANSGGNLEVSVWTVDSSGILTELSSGNTTNGGTVTLTASVSSGQEVYVEVKGYESSVGVMDQVNYDMKVQLS
jgi:hypothetical protein